MRKHLKEIRDIFVSLAVIAVAVVGILVWTDMHGCGDRTETAGTPGDCVLEIERAFDKKTFIVCIKGHEFYCLSSDDQSDCLPFSRVLTDDGKPITCKVGVGISSRQRRSQ